MIGEAGDGRGSGTPGEGAAADLVVLDVQLPDLNGFEVTTLLRGYSSAWWVLVSSRDDYSAAVVGTVRAGSCRRTSCRARPARRAAHVSTTGYASDSPRPRSTRPRPGPWPVLVGASIALLAAAPDPPCPSCGSRRGPLRPPRSRRNCRPPTSASSSRCRKGTWRLLGGVSPNVLVARVESSAFGHAPTEAIHRQRCLQDRVELSDLVIGACAADYRLTLPDYVPVRIVASLGEHPPEQVPRTGGPDDPWWNHHGRRSAAQCSTRPRQQRHRRRRDVPARS